MISKLNAGRLVSALAQPIIKDTTVEKTTKSSHMFKIPPKILVSILEIMPNPAPAASSSSSSSSSSWY
jgi:hypothetical protein